MSSEVFDCIVIGAGIQGSCTAYQLAKNKQKTLLLEQFVLPHSRGSSHGQTRIIRKSYEEDFYVQMMHESYELWAQLEREAGVELHRRTGLLVMGPENGEGFSRLKATMQKHKIPTVFLEKQEFSQHIPNVNLAEGNGALIDTFAGVLYADRALRAVQRLFQSCGGVIKDGEKVIDISPGAEVTVTTGSGVYRGRSLVISAGPWANTLLTHTGLQLPLKVVKINVCYWKEKIPGTYSVGQSFPCFIEMEPKEGEYDIYGLPSNEYPGLMKCACMCLSRCVTTWAVRPNRMSEINRRIEGTSIFWCVTSPAVSLGWCQCLLWWRAVCTRSRQTITSS
ncbi:peroxisomal sarcosine oxidase isoform X2 [Carassius carassius]|uniref:peroxisomal sarcosine oxidase isoform X2 n=1 Tax=Carassius carassius TaxID=217509 RepID=UPI00286907C2|nr:peroxisomal sarcosine oxidase isoform X2 [Carassius carassius]